MKNLNSSDETCSKQDSNFSHRNETVQRNRHRRPDKPLYVPRALRSAEKQSSIFENIIEVVKERKNSSNNEDNVLSSNNEDNVLSSNNEDNVFNSNNEANVLLTVNIPNVEMLKTVSIHKVSENSITDNIKSIKELTQSSCSSTSDVSDIEGSCSDSIQTNKIENNLSQNEKTKFSKASVKPGKKVNNNYCSLEAKSVLRNHKTQTKNCICDEKNKYLSDSEKFSMPTVNNDKCEEHDDVQNLNLNPPTSMFPGNSKSKEYFDVKECVLSSAKNDNSVMLDDSWETMFNDEGDCLDPEVINELCKVTGRSKIHVAKNDFSDYEPDHKTIYDNYDHIVELSFPSEFNTQDLVSSLSIFHQEAYTIKWVDDCHALAVFTSPTLANQALQLTHQLVKIRPISDGTKESKAKARWLNRHEEPSKPRPTTSTLLARRLVSGALGLKDRTPKEQREKEKNMLKEAREKKRLKAKQRQDIWDGVVL